MNLTVFFCDDLQVNAKIRNNANKNKKKAANNCSPSVKIQFSSFHRTQLLLS